MTDRQLYVCVLALFDDGWPYPAIAKALGIDEERARKLACMNPPPGEYKPENRSTKDENGRIIVRNEAGEIVQRVERL